MSPTNVTGRERPAHADRSPVGGHDHGNRSEHRQGGGIPGERGGAVEGHHRHHDRGEPDDPHQQAEPRPGPGGHAGQHAAADELPGAGAGREVGHTRRRRGEVDRVAEAGDGHHGQDGRDRASRVPVRTGSHQPGDEQHQGQGDVELLLHRQRPEVLHGRRRLLRAQVVDRLRGEHPVLDVEGGADQLVEHIGTPAERHHGHGRDRHAQQHQQRCRQQPLGAPGPEPAEADPPARLELLLEVCSDEVAGDDEEDVHADEPAGQARGPEVEQQHRADRHRPQGLDVGPVALGSADRRLSRGVGAGYGGDVASTMCLYAGRRGRAHRSSRARAGRDSRPARPPFAFLPLTWSGSARRATCRAPSRSAGCWQRLR